MRKWLILVLLLASGCTGRVVDVVSGKGRVLEPQLARYGLAGDLCVARRLDADLTLAQARQLADLAARLQAGGVNPAALGPREFGYVAGLVEDEAVGVRVARALAECELSTDASAGTIVAGELPLPTADAPAATIFQGELPPPSPAPSASIPAPASHAPSLWVSLGTARTGQGIAVDAASVTRGPGWRQAWFRLLNGDMPDANDLGYLLRIDCPGKTITAYAGHRYGAGGRLIEQKEYSAPEGPLPIEPGTVMDVAFQSLCYEPG